MKTLLLMRHAKSSWDDSTVSDHDRPLNARGKTAAPRMGRLMADEGLLPDRVFSSTAERARATAVEVARHCGYRGEIEYRTELYLASPAMYREVLSELPHDCQTVLVIGHNPGLEDLLAQLTGDEEHLSTAALARVTFELPTWSDFTSHTRGKLLNLWRPKELDPE